MATMDLSTASVLMMKVRTLSLVFYTSSEGVWNRSVAR